MVSALWPNTHLNQKQNTLEAFQQQQDILGTALGLYHWVYTQTK